ncbi:MAG TPA: hypothetical protein VK085_03335 [Pseudogracilibacillus sp.]|nr:hypothetical protein [Pseudogracilibacillus sp.]
METMKDALWLTGFELKCMGIRQVVLLIDFQVSRILDSIFILSFVFIPDVTDTEKGNCIISLLYSIHTF